MLEVEIEAHIREDSGLDSLRAREETAVDSVHDRLSGDLFSTEEATIQALYGVLATLDAVKLQVNVALRVRI